MKKKPLPPVVSRPSVVCVLCALAFVTACKPRPVAPEGGMAESGVAADPGAPPSEKKAHYAVALDMASFEEKVLKSPGVALVDFWAEWCGPCRAVAPAVEAVAKKYDGRALVGKVDVDSQGDLAQKYGINAIPALLVFKNGEVVEQIVGGVPQSELESALEKHL